MYLLIIIAVPVFCIGAFIAAIRASRRGEGTLGVLFSSIAVGFMSAVFATVAAWVGLMIMWGMGV